MLYLNFSDSPASLTGRGIVLWERLWASITQLVPEIWQHLLNGNVRVTTILAKEYLGVYLTQRTDSIYCES